jgi:hypothetical protein
MKIQDLEIELEDIKKLLNNQIEINVDLTNQNKSI